MELTKGSLYLSEYPLLLLKLKEEGIDYLITYSGVEWYITTPSGKSYKIAGTQIVKAWDLPYTNWRTFCHWLVERWSLHDNHNKG